MEEKLYDIWFSSLDLENKNKLNLLDKYNAKEIWKLNLKDLIENGISEDDIIKILNFKKLNEAENIFEYMSEKNIKLISIKDENYPHKLHNIVDKPAYIYVRGDEKILDDDAVRNCWM